MARMITALLVAIVASVSGCRNPDAVKSASTNDIESVIAQFSTNSPEARKRIERYVVKNPKVGEEILLRIAYSHKYHEIEARRFMVQQMGRLKMPEDMRIYDILGALAGTGDVDAVVALMEMGNSTADKVLGRGVSKIEDLGVLRYRPVVFDGLLRMACASPPENRPYILRVLVWDEALPHPSFSIFPGQTPPPIPPPVRYAPYSQLTKKEVERRVKLVEGLNTNGLDRASLDLLVQVKKALQRPRAK